MVSLLFNVIGSTVAGKHSLEIIRVYLTFPLGERALPLGSGSSDSAFVISDGTILALGCCLYIGTGMVLGSFFHCVISRFAEHKSVFDRVAWGTALGAGVWFVNYYLILSWLQPALFGGNWITNNEYLPWWVALATHLVFGCLESRAPSPSASETLSASAAIGRGQFQEFKNKEDIMELDDIENMRHTRLRMTPSAHRVVNRVCMTFQTQGSHTASIDQKELHPRGIENLSPRWRLHLRHETAARHQTLRIRHAVDSHLR